MTLQVPFEDYAAAAKRFEISEAYLVIEHEQVKVSGCNPKHDVTLVCLTSTSEPTVKAALEKQGLAVYRGVWSENICALDRENQNWYVAAVSYQSGGHVPGVWMDAYQEEPNHVHVLQALYEEFRQTGEMPHVTIEEFIRNANPNVVVVSDTQLKGFIDAKQAANPVPRVKSADMSEVRLSVVVPAYNEEVRLGRSLPKIFEYYSAQDYSYEVVVVSDGSTDGTVDMVREFCKDHPQFRLKEYTPNRGKGYAVKTGMLEATGELILFCDADLATPQEETVKLLERIADGADVAIGSRPLRDSDLEVHQPFYREMMGRLGNKLIQLLAIRGIQDTQCGFKLFTGESANAIFRRCKLDGFSFDFEALMIARDLGYRIDEVPIRWLDQAGSKVVPWRDYPRALRDLVKLRLKGKADRLREA